MCKMNLLYGPEKKLWIFSLRGDDDHLMRFLIGVFVGIFIMVLLSVKRDDY